MWIVRLYGVCACIRVVWCISLCSNVGAYVLGAGAVPPPDMGTAPAVSHRRDSNSGPQSYQDCALPSELRRQVQDDDGLVMVAVIVQGYCQQHA